VRDCRIGRRAASSVVQSTVQLGLAAPELRANVTNTSWYLNPKVQHNGPDSKAILYTLRH
jgi:hypothetical protein